MNSKNCSDSKSNNELEKELEKINYTIENGKSFMNDDQMRFLINKKAELEKEISSKKKITFPINKKTFLIAVAGIAICAIIAVVLIIKNMSPSINLDDYLSITVEGKNGYAKPMAEIDFDAIQEKYGEKLKFNKSKKSEAIVLSMLATPIIYMENCISIEFDNSNDLSNGDEIGYVWVVDDSFTNMVNCKLTYTDGAYIVNNLQEPEIVNLFDDIEVEFTGKDGYGVVNLIYNGNDFYYSDINISNRFGLRNGDTINIEFNEAAIDRYTKQTQNIVETYEKEYIVEGLETYLTSLDMLPEDSLSTLKKYAVDEYNSEVVDEWGDERKLLSFDYVGAYFVVANDADTSPVNRLYLLYKVKARAIHEKKGVECELITDYYWTISYDNIMNSTTAITTDEITSRTSENKYVIDRAEDGSTFGYNGFTSEEEFVEVCVNSKNNKYSSEKSNMNLANASTNVEYNYSTDPGEGNEWMKYILYKYLEGEAYTAIYEANGIFTYWDYDMETGKHIPEEMLWNGSFSILDVDGDGVDELLLDSCSMVKDWERNNNWVGTDEEYLDLVKTNRRFFVFDKDYYEDYLESPGESRQVDVSGDRPVYVHEDIDGDHIEEIENAGEINFTDDMIHEITSENIEEYVK